MINKKGFTLTELIVTVGLLTGIMVLVYSIFDQVILVGNKVKNTIENQTSTNLALGTIMKDFQSMSFVMTLQRNLVPCSLTGGSHAQPKQTLKLLNTCTAAYISGTVVTLDKEIFKFDRSDYDYPFNSISFSIGLSDADFQSGISGNSAIRTNYFLKYRDDDNDGKSVNSNGTSEDSERDGIDNDLNSSNTTAADGLDGEEPDDEGMIVGYQVTYYLDMKNKIEVRNGDGTSKYIQFAELRRKQYFPHNNTTVDKVLVSNVVLFSILPFKVESGVRQIITPDLLTATWDSSTNKYTYGTALSNFSISFEVIICTSDIKGNIVPFKRVFTPMIFTSTGS